MYRLLLGLFLPVPILSSTLSFFFLPLILTFSFQELLVAPLAASKLFSLSLSSLYPSLSSLSLSSSCECVPSSGTSLSVGPVAASSSGAESCRQRWGGKEKKQHPLFDCDKHNGKEKGWKWKEQVEESGKQIKVKCEGTGRELEGERERERESWKRSDFQKSWKSWFFEGESPWKSVSVTNCSSSNISHSYNFFPLKVYLSSLMVLSPPPLPLSLLMMIDFLSQRLSRSLSSFILLTVDYFLPLQKSTQVPDCEQKFLLCEFPLIGLFFSTEHGENESKKERRERGWEGKKKVFPCSFDLFADNR